MAATWRASAPPRSPISARSRAGSRWRGGAAGGAAAVAGSAPARPLSARARAARDRVLDRVAAAGVVPRTRSRAPRRSRCRTRARQLPMLAPHAADQIVSAEPERPRAPAHHRRQFAEERCRSSRAMRAQRDRAEGLRRDPRGRQRDRRGARRCRLGRLLRRRAAPARST